MSDRIIFPSQSKRLVLGFIVIGGEVVLSARRRTPWEGCLSGLGGNVEEYDFGSFDAMRREAKQEAEIIICPSRIEKRGEFKIFRQGKQMVTLDVFVISYYEEELMITDEMGPHLYFPIKSLPLHEMVSGDEFWVKRILDGECLMGEHYRSGDAEKLIDIKVWPCFSFI